MVPYGPEITPDGVPLSELVANLDLEVVTDGGVDLRTRVVTSPVVNRPGLQWAGYSEQFPTSRLQLIGKAEFRYLDGLAENVRWARLEQYAQLGMSAVVLAWGLPFDERGIEVAHAYGIPVLRSPLPSNEIARALSWFLSLELAPRSVMHAGLVDVAGEGVLILGKSGIGKSEAALELIRRGHRLVADDTVEVRRLTEHELIGRAPGRTRHFMEIKGIGIVNLRLMYGVGSVKAAAELTMVVSLEYMDPGRDFSEEPDTTEVLGVTLPLVTIPVRPGRNTAILIETAAMDVRAERLLRTRPDRSSGAPARADLLESLGP